MLKMQELKWPCRNAALVPALWNAISNYKPLNIPQPPERATIPRSHVALPPSSVTAAPTSCIPAAHCAPPSKGPDSWSQFVEWHAHIVQATIYVCGRRFQKILETLTRGDRWVLKARTRASLLQTFVAHSHQNFTRSSNPTKQPTQYQSLSRQPHHSLHTKHKQTPWAADHLVLLTEAAITNTPTAHITVIYHPSQ